MCTGRCGNSGRSPEKYVTVVGEVEHPVTVRVPVGISIGEVTAMAGAVTVDDPVYLLGGPMMGNFGQRTSR